MGILRTVRGPAVLNGGDGRIEVSAAPDLARSGDYSVVRPITVANPVNGVRVTGATQPLVGRLFEPLLAAMAVGGYLEAQLGDVYDIIDVGATALVGNIVDVLLPSGVIYDLVYLTRLKTMDRYITMIPAGLWRFSNVSAAVVPAGTLIGFSHMASRQLLTN